MQTMRREHAKTAAYPQAQKSKENFRTCFARAKGNTIGEINPCVIRQGTMASNNQRYAKRLEEELAKIDPATLQYLEQLLAENAPAARKVSRTCWKNQFPKKRRSFCKNLYSQSLTNQDPLHAKESREKRKRF